MEVGLHELQNKINVFHFFKGGGRDDSTICEMENSISLLHLYNVFVVKVKKNLDFTESTLTKCMVLKRGDPLDGDLLTNQFVHR